METAENTRRWLALSRIVTTTNLCEEYLTKHVYPRFQARGQRCLDSPRKGGVGLPSFGSWSWVTGPNIRPRTAGDHLEALRASLCSKGFCVFRNRKWSHVLSPKRDFKLNDVMGGIVITFPLDG